MAEDGTNYEVVEAWNTILFDKFLRFRPVLASAFGEHGSAAIERHVPRAAARVLDIGCGFGDSTLKIAARLVSPGEVIGVDAAARFVDEARATALAAGAGRATFEVGDVETRVPDGPFDLAFAQFGTMFFASPVIALRRVREALAPGGKLCMVVWRKREANPCWYVAELVARELLGDPPKDDQLTCGPGPFSMASADLVGDQLAAAGYRDIAFERHDTQMMIGRDLAEAVAFALALGPAGEVVRLSGDAAIARTAEIEAAVARALAPFVTAGGVYAASSTWFVTARAPGS